MPHHKDKKKRAKTSAKARERNRGYRSELRSAIRDLRTETNSDVAQRRYRTVSGLLDRAANRGLIHRNRASRYKSRLSRFVRGIV